MTKRGESQHASGAWSRYIGPRAQQASQEIAPPTRTSPDKSLIPPRARAPPARPPRPGRLQPRPRPPGLERNSEGRNSDRLIGERLGAPARSPKNSLPGHPGRGGPPPPRAAGPHTGTAVSVSSRARAVWGCVAGGARRGWAVRGAGARPAPGGSGRAGPEAPGRDRRRAGPSRRPPGRDDERHAPSAP